MQYHQTINIAFEQMIASFFFLSEPITFTLPKIKLPSNFHIASAIWVVDNNKEVFCAVIFGFTPDAIKKFLISKKYLQFAKVFLR